MHCGGCVDSRPDRSESHNPTMLETVLNIWSAVYLSILYDITCSPNLLKGIYKCKQYLFLVNSKNNFNIVLIW